MRIGTITGMGDFKLGFMAMRAGRRLRDPWVIESWIVAGWNWVACRVVGHNRMLDGVREVYDAEGRFPCTACCARLTTRLGAVDPHLESEGTLTTRD